jgi:O-antigen ligase
MKLMAAVILFVVILGMFATYSRGGFLLTVMAFALMALQNWRHITKLHIGLFLLMSVSVPVVLVATAPDEYFAHQMTLYSGDTSSIDRRITYLEVARDAFFESPLIGHGPNAFRDIYSESDQAREFVKEDQSSRRAAHNTFVDVAIGSGILGLFAFLALLAVAFGHYNRAVRIAVERGNRTLESLFASYRLSLFLLSMYMLIKSVLDNKYLWLLLAVSVLALRVAKTIEQREEVPANGHV